MQYLILGNGWIGNLLCNYLRSQGDDARIYDERFENESILGHIFDDYDVMVNTIARTDIDWCEKNKRKTLDTNVILAANLAEKTYEMRKKYIFFSSACIFESPQGFTNHSEAMDKGVFFSEISTPNPQCFYAETKVMAEKLVLEAQPNALILRPRLPISEIHHPRNTLDKLKKYEYINNSQESITVVEDMLPVIKQLVEKDEKGIFHLINQGTMSPAEMAQQLGYIFKVVSKEEQDARLKKEERAKRVTTYITSTRTPLLPHIRERFFTLKEKYNA